MIPMHEHVQFVENRWLRMLTARQRVPVFMRESPADGEVARRMKRAYSTVDTFRYSAVFERRV